MSKTILAATAAILLVACAAVATVQLIGVGGRQGATEQELRSRIVELERRLEDLGDGRSSSLIDFPPAILPVGDIGATAPTREREMVERFPTGPQREGWEELSHRLEIVESQLTALLRDPIERGYEFLRSPSAQLRRDGIELLERLARNDPRALAAIREMLGDLDPRVREQALESLADLDDIDSLPLMLGMLGDGEVRVRREVVSSLEALLRELEPGSALAADAVAALSRSARDADGNVRERAIEALGNARTPQATATLIAALDDQEADVRSEAIRALGRGGDRSAVPALRSVYSGADGRNRMTAAISLWRLGDRDAFRQEAVTLVHDATAHENERERSRAVHLLGEVSPSEYRATIEQALQDPSERVRRTAERILNGSGWNRGRGR